MKSAVDCEVGGVFGAVSWSQWLALWPGLLCLFPQVGLCGGVLDELVPIRSIHAFPNTAKCKSCVWA